MKTEEFCAFLKDVRVSSGVSITDLSKKYGWHRLNKCCLEINGVMSRYERLPMVSLSNREVKDVKKTINLIKKKLNSWKKLKINE